MTALARPPGRLLTSFSLPSEPGNERRALALVAEAVSGLALPSARLDKLKTAVAEATMNAIEHGNGNRAEVPVEVAVLLDGTDLVVTISDQGGAAPERPGEAPDLARKLAGDQSPRGWGLFLIKSMVDSLDVATDGPTRTVRLTVHTQEPSRKAGRGEQPV